MSQAKCVESLGHRGMQKCLNCSSPKLRFELYTEMSRHLHASALGSRIHRPRNEDELVLHMVRTTQTPEAGAHASVRLHMLHLEV